MRIKLLRAELDLFEGGAAGGTGSAAAAGAEGSAATSGENSTVSVTGKRSKGEYANVLFGKQESAPAEEQIQTEASEDNADPQSQEDRTKAYKDFITQNKDLYEADLNEKFKKKTAKRYELEGKIKEQQAVIDRMMSRYGLENADLSQLNEAMDNDDSYYSQKADEMGMTIDQYKRLESLERENAMLQRTQSERLAEQEALIQEQKRQADIDRWMQQAMEVKEMYPNFDLDAELQNPRFAALLRDGNMSMQEVYRTFHFDEIMAQGMQQTAQNTEKAVTQNIRARGSRPLENGTISQSAFTVKSDVTKLTPRDRAEIARRALAGERITF